MSAFAFILQLRMQYAPHISDIVLNAVCKYGFASEANFIRLVLR